MTDIHDPTFTPPPPPVVQPPPPPPPPDTRLVWFKEIVTALLTIAVFVALMRAYSQLCGMPDVETYKSVTDAVEKKRMMEANESNVETIAAALLGIFGAFVGYYSGRIPAEKAAAAANTNAAQSQQTATNAQQAAAAAAANAASLLRKVDQQEAWAEHAADLMQRAAGSLSPDMQAENAALRGDDRSSLASELAYHARRRR